MATHIRLPDPKDIDEMLQGVSKRSEMSERKLKTAIGNALASMSAGDKRQLLGDLRLTDATVQDLLKRPRVDDAGRGNLKAIINKMKAMDASGLAVYPGAVPDVRELTKQEQTDMAALAAKVAKTMRDVAAGHHDKYVKNVFGDGHEDDAKKVFKGAAEALEGFTTSWFGFGIVADVMRKNDVWCCGALTNSTRMALSEGVATGAADHDMKGRAFLTLVHESTHALPKGATTDVLYEHHDGFLKAGPQAKKRSADYYKEVVRQIATKVERVFVPGDVDPHLGDTRSAQLMQAAVKADKVLNGAWITAIRIHDQIHRMAREPGKFGGWETWLRNASRLMGITVHREAQLEFKRNLFGANTGPKITSGDLALMDNKIAMLAACNGKAKFVMTEPTVALTADKFVEHVLEQVIMTFRTGLKFSKSIEKDVIVVRSLGELHESVNAGGKNLLLNPADPSKPGLAQLPEPMKTYDASR